MSLLNDFSSTGKTKKTILVVGSALVLICLCCFFDGAAAISIGGVGIHLAINHLHFFNLKMGYGHSTNTMVELLALWDLLYFTDAIGLPCLQIFGDSYVVIN